MTEHIVMTIRSQTATKYGKYRVVLVMKDARDRVCWMTQKQLDAINGAFYRQEIEYGKRWSNKHRQIIGVFDGDRYCYCKTIVNKDADIRVFKRPRDYDLSDLLED